MVYLLPILMMLEVFANIIDLMAPWKPNGKAMFLFLLDCLVLLIGERAAKHPS